MEKCLFFKYLPKSGFIDQFQFLQDCFHQKKMCYTLSTIKFMFFFVCLLGLFFCYFFFCVCVCVCVCVSVCLVLIKHRRIINNTCCCQ